MVREITRLLPSLSAVFALAGCATAPPAAPPERAALPTAAQVEAYVRDHWASYERRVAGFAPPHEDRSTLVSVRTLGCDDYFGTPECRFAVVARFADGREREETLSSTFDWLPDGSLREVIVLVHERRR